MATVLDIIRKGNGSGSFSADANGQWMFWVYYQVVFDRSDAVASEAALADLGEDRPADEGPSRIPPFGDRIGSFVLMQKDPQQQESSPRDWMVGCQYKIPLPGQEQRPDDPSVDRWAIDISGTSITYEEEINHFDITVGSEVFTLPIRNSTGDWIRGVTEPKSDEDLTVAYTCVEIPWDVMKACRNKSNDRVITLTINGVVRTFAINTLRLDTTAWTATINPDIADPTVYPRLTLRFLYREDNWDHKLPNRSFFHLLEDGTKEENTVDGTPPPPNGSGVPLSDPQPIDPYGQLIPEGEPIDIITVPAKQADFTELLRGIGT
jgi:hypothetical protein